jgi:hypothetical protein
LPVPKQGPNARYYGASHLYSDDAGETWRQFGDKTPLAPQVDATRLKRIEAEGMPPERIEANYGGPPGPLHSYHHKILASNPIVDDRGRPWVIVDSPLVGDAHLFRHEEEGKWIGTPLGEVVRSLLPGYLIRYFGQLSRHRDGTIEVVLMTSPRANRGWGAIGTTLVRLIVDMDARVIHQQVVNPPQPDRAQWLPSLQRWCPHAPPDKPALLYTRGINAGGYSQNRNRVETEVWLQIPMG